MNKYGKDFTFNFMGKVGTVDQEDNVHFDGQRYQAVTAPKDIKYAVERARYRVLGIPDSVRIYDNPRYNDRYTVVFMDNPEKGGYEALGMNTEPYHGIGMHVTATPGYHLGRRVWFCDIPPACQQFLMEELDGELNPRCA